MKWFKDFFEDVWEEKAIRNIIIGVALLMLALIGTGVVLLVMSLFR